MTDFEQPRTTNPDDPKATKVSKFSMDATSLTLVVTRDGADAFSRQRPKPSAADIPADYLAAINQWIAGTLR